MKLILASQSKRRQQVLKDAGYDFGVIVSNVDETAIRDDDPVQLVQKLAQAKAEAVAKLVSEPALVIGADTVVMFQGKLREKPVNDDEAREFLESYRHQMVSAVHGVAVMNTANGKIETGTEQTDTYFNDISDEVITELIESKIVFEWAGGYYPADPLMVPCIEKIVGSVSSQSGLPLVVLERLMKAVA